MSRHGPRRAEADGSPVVLAPTGVVAGIADWAARIEAVTDAARAAAELLPRFASALEAGRGSVLVRDPEAGSLVLLAGLELPDRPSGAHRPSGRRSISEHVLREQRSLLLHGIVHDVRFEASAPADRLASAMCVPLPGRRGPMGTLNLARLEPASRFTAEDLASVEAAAPAFAAVLERGLELAAARTLRRELVARRGEPDAGAPSDGIAVSIVPGTRAASGVCERFTHPDGSVTFLLATPSGSPAAALLLAERLRAAFHAAAGTVPGPAALARAMEAGLARRWPGHEARAWLGHWTSNGEFRSCAAGAQAPFWIPIEGDAFQRLREGGPALGAGPTGARREETSIRLLPGDLLVALSESLCSGRSESDLVELLFRHRREALEDQVRAITSAGLEPIGAAAPTHDLIAIALRHDRRD